MTAVLFDLQRGRIPNSVIVTGILLGGAYHLFTGGILGTMIFLGGVFLPVVLFGAFYYFRMIGAGDVKLLCVVGGFLGPSACFSCIVAAVLSGGVISMVLMAEKYNIAQKRQGKSRIPGIGRDSLVQIWYRTRKNIPEIILSLAIFPMASIRTESRNFLRPSQMTVFPLFRV